MWENENTQLAQTSNSAASGIHLAEEPRANLAQVRADEADDSMLAMVRIAQGLQRDPAALIDRAKQIGGLLGKSGFYRFPAGGGTVEGPSIDMAQALAQEWGAITYQVKILHSEPLASGGQRMQLRARVVDMKSLVCAEVDQVISTTAPPGKFASKPDQRERWHAMQAQSAASKIVRNAILRVLPAWYVEQAFRAAMAADNLSATNGKPLDQARAEAVRYLKGTYGIAQQELEAYVGQPVDLWAAPQLATCRDLAGDLKRGDLSVEAFRAALAPEDAVPAEPARSALGVPAKKAEASKKPKKPKREPEPESDEHAVPEGAEKWVSDFNAAPHADEIDAIERDLAEVVDTLSGDALAAIKQAKEAALARVAEGEREGGAK